MVTRRDVLRVMRIREIVASHTDMSECAKELVEKGYAVSRAEGKRLFMQMKDTTGEAR